MPDSPVRLDHAAARVIYLLKGHLIGLYIVNDSCNRCKIMDCVEVCPRGLLLRGREYARDPSGRMHRLRCLRAGMSCGRHKTRHGPGA
jgi:NAD-dependent dihydropyrimidine dehydrogenase PreA subunit